MKKDIMTFLTALLAFCLACSLAASAYAATGWTQRQTMASQIADIAREMGLPEDDPIIARAKELWHSDEGKERDIAILSRVMYWEEGRDITKAEDLTPEKEEKLLLVGKTVYNRVNDERFPDTVYGVVTQKTGVYYQYLPAYANGDSRYNVPADVLAIFEDLARRVLDGEPFDCPEDVIYADTRTHGDGVYKSFYNATLGNTTYFCYG